MEQSTGRIPSASKRYDVSKNTMRVLAEQAGAIIKVGRIVLVDYKRMDEYFAEHRNTDSLFPRKGTA